MVQSNLEYFGIPYYIICTFIRHKLSTVLGKLPFSRDPDPDVFCETWSLSEHCMSEMSAMRLVFLFSTVFSPLALTTQLLQSIYTTLLSAFCQLVTPTAGAELCQICVVSETGRRLQTHRHISSGKIGTKNIVSYI